MFVNNVRNKCQNCKDFMDRLLAEQNFKLKQQNLELLRENEKLKKELEEWKTKHK